MVEVLEFHDLVEQDELAVQRVLVEQDELVERVIQVVS